MNQYNKKAFTLVELIVVITILAILWTIAFISLQWYSAQARDSKRLSDVQNIKKSLELFSLNTWKYPLPDDGEQVLYWVENDVIWTQWIVWDNVYTNLSRNLNEKPIDPFTELEYTYSTINSQTKYEVLSVYESDLVWFNNLLDTINAASLNYPKVDWNYNGLFVKTDNYYFPTPSLITSEDPTWLTLDSTNIKSQIITGWNNLPTIWTTSWITEWLDIKLSVFTWSLNSESTPAKREEFIIQLQWAYTWTILANQDIYKYLLAISTDEDEIEDYVDLVILNKVDVVLIWNEIETITCEGWYIEQWWVCVENIKISNLTFSNTSDWLQENNINGTNIDQEILTLFYQSSDIFEATAGNMINPANVTWISGEGYTGQDWQGLIDGTRVNERDTNNVFYWHLTMPNSYVSFNVTENFRIWRSWTVTWGTYTGKVKIEKLEEGNWVVIPDKHLDISNIDQTSWERFTDELEAWSYRFYLDTSTYYRLDSEWFFEKKDSWYLINQPYYVTTSNINQLDLSSVFKINSVNITNTQPIWTSIKSLVSFDWKTTWKKWNGSSWITHIWGLWDLQTGNTISEIQIWLTDLNITTEENLDFAFDLSTNDANLTPEISGISIDYLE